MTGAEAVYARVLDGAHLWLAVEGADALRLGPVAVEADRDGDLLVAVVALDDVLGATDEAVLTDAAGSPVRPPPAAPDGPTRDSGGFEVVDGGGAVVVRRLAPARGVEVSRFETLDAGVRVHLTLPDGAGTRAEVVQGGSPIGELPVVAGAVVVDDVVGLAPGSTATLRVPGSGPVVRARNVLARPNFAVLLPPLDHGLELRWQPNGRLAVHRAPA